MMFYMKRRLTILQGVIYKPFPLIASLVSCRESSGHKGSKTWEMHPAGRWNCWLESAHFAFASKLEAVPYRNHKAIILQREPQQGDRIGLAFLVAFQGPRKERILFVYGNLICRVTSAENNKESIDDRKSKKWLQEPCVHRKTTIFLDCKHI